MPDQHEKEFDPQLNRDFGLDQHQLEYSQIDTSVYPPLSDVFRIKNKGIVKTSHSVQAMMNGCAAGTTIQFDSTT
jgi:hypothetical protein